MTYSLGGVVVIDRVSSGGSQRDTVFQVGNHLGSASLVVDVDGNILAAPRYLPFGEERWDEVNLPSDRGFTNQRHEREFNLRDYNARFYSSYLGRFISPDTLIPDPQNELDWDKFQYVRSNPVNATDPTGHFACWDENADDPGCWVNNPVTKSINEDQMTQDKVFQFIFPGSGENGEWTDSDKMFYRDHRLEFYIGQKQWVDEPRTWDTFADHVQRMASHYGITNKDIFVRDFALFFGGLSASKPWVEAAWEAKNGPVIPYFIEGNEGLNSKYLDSLDDEDNQSHHYAGIFIVGYINGGYAGVGINIGRDSNLAEFNIGDIRLGNVAAADGDSFRYDSFGTLPPDTISNWIRELSR